MKHELTSIRRERIDGNKIQGFVLDESDKLLLLAYVYDFNADGLMVLRKEDISDIESSETDKFQTQLLIDEGIYSSINFNVKYNLESWREFLKSAKEKHSYFILEQEVLEEPDFAIGRIELLEEDHLNLKYFTGTARWLEKLEEIPYSELTACQIASNYLNVYERYFQKQDA